MAGMRTIPWQIFANGILIVTLSVGEILYSVISLTGTIAQWRHREFPYGCGEGFPIQKSGFPRFTQELLWLQLLREAFYGRRKMRLWWAYL